MDGAAAPNDTAFRNAISSASLARVTSDFRGSYEIRTR
jgi:hypothetical protein